MAWSFDEHTPVYLQIADRIKNKIISGDYLPDSQIPSVRQLALIAAVNPNTVQRALSELENENIIYSKGTQGRFVTADPELLSNIKYKSAKKLVGDFVKQAKRLSITKEELMKMIEEENL